MMRPVEEDDECDDEGKAAVQSASTLGHRIERLGESDGDEGGTDGEGNEEREEGTDENLQSTCQMLEIRQ